MDSRILIAALSAALLFSACGGSPDRDRDRDPEPDLVQTESLDIPVDPAFEGNVSSAGLSGASENYIWLGDDSAGRAYRAVSGFPLASIPAGATITEATLEVYLAQPFRFGAPHANLGNVVVDLVDLGSAINAVDYTGSILSSIGVLSDTPGPGTRMLDVTDAVKEAMSLGLDRADFRSRFMLRTNNDDRADMIMLNGVADLADVGVTSTLHVTYQVAGN